MLVPRKITTPKNESDLHFFLKQVALAMLAQRFKCRLIATEVYLPDISRERCKLRKEAFKDNKGIYSDNENRAKIITHALMQRSRNQLTWENLWFYPGFNQKKNKKFLKHLNS